ncbi:hypothetical protein P7C71_g3381, partial [Lecanoromycetidae sp. Uapishka_2]
MATETSPSDLTAAADSEKDETRILASLARLQEMHVALRHLRETIPRVVESVLLQPSQPELLHSHFKKAATGAAKDIRDFTLLMAQSGNKEVLEKAKESRARDPEGIMAWLVSEHKDWLDVRRGEISDDVDMDGEEGEIKNPAAADDDKMKI